jgi:AraC family transcriptional regulator, regulatory protein of adaptative response / methylated-DNA-[protein]-cysteine methyltransferase
MSVMAATREKAMARFPGEEDRWAAVLGRDPRADGHFFFAVRTTGVYCRPSCPSRRARRENVSFHTTREEAERAGFRACKRCRPSEASLAEQRRAAVTRACRLIETADDPPTLDELADSTGMSRFHFHRVFKAATGLTPRAYAAGRRAERVRKELPRSQTVTEALYGAGFGSAGRFYATAADILGMTPTSFRCGGNGASIRFAVGSCSLGSVLVAATERGVCAILFGENPAALARDLRGRFPKAP